MAGFTYLELLVLLFQPCSPAGQQFDRVFELDVSISLQHGGHGQVAISTFKPPCIRFPRFRSHPHNYSCRRLYRAPIQNSDEA